MNEIDAAKICRALGDPARRPLSQPYPEELGGGGQPYELYLQVLDLSDLEHLAVVAADVMPALG